MSLTLQRSVPLTQWTSRSRGVHGGCRLIFQPACTMDTESMKTSNPASAGARPATSAAPSGDKSPQAGTAAAATPTNRGGWDTLKHEVGVKPEFILTKDEIAALRGA